MHFKTYEEGLRFREKYHERHPSAESLFAVSGGYFNFASALVKGKYDAGHERAYEYIK